LGYSRRSHHTICSKSYAKPLAGTHGTPFRERLTGPARPKKRSEKGREYLSVRLDDPSLTQPLNRALVEQNEGDGFILVWPREARKPKAE
jgi:hypothetical protein